MIISEAAFPGRRECVAPGASARGGGPRALAVEPVAVPQGGLGAHGVRATRPGGLNAPAAAAVTGMPQRVWGARWCVSGVGRRWCTKEAEGRSSFVVVIVTNFLSSLYLTHFPIQNE